MQHLNRRQFLKQAGTLTALSLTVPSFLRQSTRALAAQPIPGLSDERTLVLIQLAGGNDGLNTVVPHANDDYYRARPKLAIAAKDVLRINDTCGFHPEMYALKDLWDAGSLSVIQNVGYPNPDLSHFRSTEIWETASSSEVAQSRGWIGRYFDSACQKSPSPVLGLQLGERTAQTFSGDHNRCVTLSNPALFQFSDRATTLHDLERLHQPAAQTSSKLDFLQRAGNDVLATSRQLANAIGNQKTTADYLPFQFSQSLKLVAQMIAAEVPTRVYYVSLGGFDHHATQKVRHAMLLQELSEGLSSFVKDLQGLGRLDSTLIMTFSEFGRRVAENQSEGTDHGTANMMFMAGGTTIAGLHGQTPDLARLDAVGDLHHTIDFRSVYAAVLRQWFKADHRPLLGNEVADLPGLLRGVS